jgi:hypothetical protein
LLALLCAIVFVLPSNGISTNFCPKQRLEKWFMPLLGASSLDDQPVIVDAREFSACPHPP